MSKSVLDISQCANDTVRIVYDDGSSDEYKYDSVQWKKITSAPPTLLDDFAKAAMQSMVTAFMNGDNERTEYGHYTHLKPSQNISEIADFISDESYCLAKAMLKRRNEETDT